MQRLLYCFTLTVIMLATVNIFYVQTKYITPSKCQLKITSVNVSHLGAYSVEASNIHGIVRSTASLNTGKKRSGVELLEG